MSKNREIIKMGLFSIFKSSKRLYFSGCSAYFKNSYYSELYERLLNKLGIDFKVVEKKICCGLPALELGFDSEARKIAKRNFEIFKEAGITHLISSEPGCHKMFLQDYPNLIPDWNIQIENIWFLILEKLELKPYLIKNKFLERVAYQDSCYLGRHLGIYDEPRKILEFLGFEIVEMNDSKENSVCCGNCGGLEFTNPDLADKIARERIIQAKRTGVKKLITNSINDLEILKRNANDEIEVLDLSEVLARALGIRKEEDSEIETEKKVLDKMINIHENQDINEIIWEEK